MKKNLIIMIVFLLITSFFISSCCHRPPPPISKTEFEELRATVIELEEQCTIKNAEIEVLEAELLEKTIELENLLDYQKQLKDEGFIEIEEE
ncbi:MAG: hypothetical protein H8D22_09530 [Candidatus Cloacimonetes bacterium]|nr:hypothetical protein [Candidatus Cloacimonadota bacterium]